MKKTIGLVVLSLFVAIAAMANKTEGKSMQYEVDTKESKVEWKATKVTGEHMGFVSISDGTVTLENEKIVGANVTMDLNTIVCTDLTNEEWNKKLVGHLKSDDFFSVEKFPNATFEISSIQANDDGKYAVIGKLTMKGKSHEIEFPASVKIHENMVKANGTATIDRTLWNIQYGSGKFFQGLGDNLIHDEFSITFDIKAKANEKLTIK
jgi:polyisoprenoid-binding protein YceI